jgi:hypothetical protein
VPIVNGDFETYDNVIPDVVENNEGARRYPARERVKPKHLDDYVTVIENSVDCDYLYEVYDVPKTCDEAVSCNDSREWQKTMDEEMHALHENNTFECKVLPLDKNVVGGKWVYAVKLDVNGEKRYKARYVAKGYSQIPEIDYFETFSPTARMTSVVCLCSYLYKKICLYTKWMLVLLFLMAILIVNCMLNNQKVMKSMVIMVKSWSVSLTSHCTV